jgi:hypothetical protein
VIRSYKTEIANFRTDYAKYVDFCRVFTTDTKGLYLLAFLLTANHAESERCFVATVEKAFNNQAVFKEWARSWVKRMLIENAIEIVSSGAVPNSHQRDFWSAEQHGPQRECEIDTVTELAVFERFVFVMSVLERYSIWECALLLGCGMNQIAEARITALRRLPDLAAFPQRVEVETEM